jgi:prepilin-type N-terminal cleavage/methylation domain-containing protein
MNRTEGFTLIETLLALVAGGILLVGLGWAIRGLTRQFQRSARLTDVERIEAATPFLEREIGWALPPATGSPFVGAARHLSLTAPAPQALGSVGSVRLDLDISAIASGVGLTARFNPTRPDQILPPQARQSVRLVEGFKDIRFRYLRRASDPARSPPRLVTVEFTGKDGTIFPLGIEPRLTMAADCVFDPDSQTCRP